MKFALIGYGKMGKMVETVAVARGHDIVVKIDYAGNEQGQALTKANLGGCDAAINFGTPESAVMTIDKVTSLGVSMVVGTTGWNQHQTEVKKMVETRNVGLVYGSNFSIGVNLFFRIAQIAAAKFREYPEYEPWIYEIHHSAKLDAPSGTALKLEQLVEGEYSGNKKIIPSSNRAGAHPGTHTLGFDAQADTVTITHTARSRAGFADGAVRAAEWIATRKGFHEFSDTLPF